jgi:phosphonate transport system substrate-binding protein
MLSQVRIRERLRPALAPIRQRPDLEVAVQVLSSYEAFVEAAIAGRFDLALAPAHLGPILSRRAGFRPVARASGPRQIDLLALADGDVRTLSDLAGRRVATPPALSLTAQVVRNLLSRVDWPPAGAPRIVEVPVQDQSILRVLEGRIDAGAAVRTVVSFLEPELRARLRVVESIEVPEVAFIMASDRLPAPLLAWLADLYPEAHEGGTATGGAMGFQGFVAASEANLLGLERYAARTEALLDPDAKRRSPRLPASNRLEGPLPADP